MNDAFGPSCDTRATMGEMCARLDEAIALARANGGNLLEAACAIANDELRETDPRMFVIAELIKRARQMLPATNVSAFVSWCITKSAILGRQQCFETLVDFAQIWASRGILFVQWRRVLGALLLDPSTANSTYASAIFDLIYPQ